MAIDRPQRSDLRLVGDESPVVGEEDVAPEFEDCRARAVEAGVSALQVYNDALAVAVTGNLLDA